MAVLMLIILTAFLTTTSDGAAVKGTCKNVFPQKDVDWSKLVGAWYNMMCLPGESTFVSCRKMLISNVNKEEKILDIDFVNIVYDGEPKFTRNNLILFKWFEDEGVIYTAIKPGNRYKLPHAAFSRKKKDKGPPSVYTLTSTDHESFIILVHCAQGEAVVWVSLKEKTIERHLADKLRRELSTLGIDVNDMDFNGTVCKP